MLLITAETHKSCSKTPISPWLGSLTVKVNIVASAMYLMIIYAFVAVFVVAPAKKAVLKKVI